ncbi:MAG: hypothetical protein HY459_03980 [Parcubacteria group bacterium]|nr:hypothetical protein [Parcubacteria group bacterium]
MTLFDFSRILDFKYLTEPVPPSLERFALAVGLSFGLVLATAMVLSVLYSLTMIQKPYDRLARRVAAMGWTIGTVGLIWFGARQTGIPYVGSRIVGYLVTLGFSVWSLVILFYLFARFPRERAKFIENKRRIQYINSQK